MSGDLEAFLASKARMPGYTGFRPGVRAVIAKVPAMAQATAAAATATPHGATTTTSSLYPALQPPGPQPSARPGTRGPARGAAPGIGDPAALSSYSSAAVDFAPPSEAFARVRSPMRNKDIEATGAGAPLRARYASAHARVGGGAFVDATMKRMRARLLAKLTGAGDNAFRLRRLFAAYDTQKTGFVSIEDFRQMGEAFGLQLGDDALLALFHVWDPQGEGKLPYEPLVSALLSDRDTFALYAPQRAAAEAALGGVAEKKAAADTARAIAWSARGGGAAVRRVLGAMAEDGGGGDEENNTLLAWPVFVAGLASVGVSLTAQQQAYLRQGFVLSGQPQLSATATMTATLTAGGGGGGGSVDWWRFCDALDEAVVRGC